MDQQIIEAYVSFHSALFSRDLVRDEFAGITTMLDALDETLKAVASAVRDLYGIAGETEFLAVLGGVKTAILLEKIEEVLS